MNYPCDKHNITQRCVEHDLSKIARIEVLLGHFVDTPVYLQHLTVKASELNLTEGLITIPFIRSTAKLEEKRDENVNGIVSTINLTWEWQPMCQGDYDWLKTLQNNPHELLIKYFGGSRRIVRTSPEMYWFTFSDENGNCKCKMTLGNGQGFTRILDD